MCIFFFLKVRFFPQISLWEKESERGKEIHNERDKALTGADEFSGYFYIFIVLEGIIIYLGMRGIEVLLYIFYFKNMIIPIFLKLAFFAAIFLTSNWKLFFTWY